MNQFYFQLRTAGGLFLTAATPPEPVTSWAQAQEVAAEMLRNAPADVGCVDVLNEPRSFCFSVRRSA